jgi:hypothetical protein
MMQTSARLAPGDLQPDVREQFQQVGPQLRSDAASERVILSERYVARGLLDVDVVQHCSDHRPQVAVEHMIPTMSAGAVP